MCAAVWYFWCVRCLTGRLNCRYFHEKHTRANHGVAGKPALLFVTASCQRKWAKLKRRYIIALAVPLAATAFFANAGSAGAAGVLPEHVVDIFKGLFEHGAFGVLKKAEMTAGQVYVCVAAWAPGHIRWPA